MVLSTNMLTILTNVTKLHVAMKESEPIFVCVFFFLSFTYH